MIADLLAAAVIASPSSRAQEVLERVSQKVVEITNSLKKAYIGKVKSVGTNSIVITTPQGDRTILTNDVTVFYRYRSGSRSETNFKGLKTGDDLAAVGTIDPQNQDLTARQITAKVARINIVGTIESNDSNILTIKEFSGQVTKVDISDTTNLKKNLATIFTPAKLSDFKAGSTVAIIGYFDAATSTIAALKASIVNY